MTALEAALTILWQGMLGIFAVMALITLIVMLFTKFSKYPPTRSKPSRPGGLDFFVRYGTIVLRDAAQTAGGRPHHPKGGETMRITLHIGSFTVTIMIKKRENRHSAK